MMHRGRIQAQGDGVEESESWNRKAPISHADGLTKKANLKNKLSKKELAVRVDAFKKARTFINNARVAGGVTAQVSKTYMVKNERNKRVDVEVIVGEAFV